VVDESGSELVERTITMFYDAMSLGGDAGKIGFATSFYSSKIAFLRATRSMVASTFRWLVFPLHVSMVGLLIFIPQVMGLFTQSINDSADTLAATSGTNLPNSSMPIGDIFSFGQVNLELINILVTLVVLVLTMANSYAPKAADGGSNIKFFYNLAIMMALTGLLLLIIPVFATSLFESITEA
jgi:flagellar protein FlaJ